MEDPNVSVIEKYKDSSSQEVTFDLNHSLFASQNEVFPDNDSGESPDAEGVLSANTGIIICSAPETPKSNDDTTSQTEEFKTPPEESRRSISCEESPRLLPTAGDSRSDGSDSGDEGQGDGMTAADSASAYLNNESAPGMMNENLGFTKTRISEMTKILSDGKTRGRDVPNVELKQFYIKKRDADSEDIKPSPKKLKASAERELDTESPKERIEIQEATMKAETVNPLETVKVEDNILVTKDNDVAGKAQSTEPLGTVKNEENINEAAVFCDKDEEHVTKEHLDLSEETAEEGLAVENDNEGSDGDSNKSNDDFEAEKGDEEDGGNGMKDKEMCSEKGKGVADEGASDGLREKCNFLCSIARPAKGGVAGGYTIMRNLLDVKGGEHEKTTKNGDDEEEREQKILDSGGARVVDEDSAAAENEEDTIKRLLEENVEDTIKRLVEENGEDAINCLLAGLVVLAQGIQRKYHHGEVDLYETAKRHGMKFPRPRWWPNSWKK